MKVTFIATVVSLMSLFSCAQSTLPGETTTACAPLTLQPGELYAQDFEGPCGDWFNRESAPVPLSIDTPPATGRKDPRWLSKVATIRAADTEHGGPFFSSWLAPVAVSPAQTYCLDLWSRWPGLGSGPVYGIHRYGTDTVDLGLENVLIGPEGFEDPEMGTVTPVSPVSGLWEHLARTVQIPADTHFVQIFGDIDWRLRTDPEAMFRAKVAMLDGVRLSLGPCEGQGFPSVCQPVEAARGLRGEYFDNRDLTNPKLTRNDGPIAFDWGMLSPDPIIGVDTFSVRWTGTIVPRHTEPYTFITTSDDGVRLWINGLPVIDNWTDHTSTENSGTTAILEADTPYEIRLESYENIGLSRLRLEWQSIHQARELVPPSRLFPPTGKACTSSQTMVAHLAFGDASGFTAADGTCNATHGTLRGYPAAPTWVGGSDGGALVLNGVANWVRVPSAASLGSLAAHNQLTVVAGVKRAAGQAGGTVVARAASASVTKASWSLGFKDSKLTWTVNGQAEAPFSCSAAVGAPIDQWIQIAGSFDGTTARAYLNGAEACSFVPGRRVLAADTTPLSIGALANPSTDVAGDFFKGTIDDLVVYNRALTATEISSSVVGGICTPKAGAPVVTTPGQVLVEEDGQTGQTTVMYTAGAADDPSGSDVTPTCTPASGTVFPVGTTTVTCTAQGEGGTGQATFDVRVTPRARGNRVALLVVGSTSLTAGEDIVRGRLLAAGYDVVIKASTSVTTADASNKALLVLTGSVGDADLGNKFNAVRVPALVMNISVMRDMTLTGNVFQSDKGFAQGQTEIDIVAPVSELAAGLKGRVAVTTGPAEMLWGKPGAAAIKVATLVGAADQATIFGYETGAALVPVSGQATLEAPARRVGFFAGTAASAAATPAGLKLLDAAIVWATQAEAVLVVESATPPLHGVADGLLRARLGHLGYAVVVKTAQQVQAAQADSADLVLVSDSASEAEIGTRLTSTRTPVVTSRAPLWAALKMVAAGATEFGQVTGSAINIVTPGHPLAGGLVGTVNVTTSPATIKWGRPAGTATKVATVPGQPTNVTIFGYPTGSALVGGVTAPGRRVGWFAQAELPRALAPDGWKLFDAAIRWAAAPDPTLAGTYALKAVHSGKCVAVSGDSVANGAGLVQSDCTAALSGRWVLRDLGGGSYEVSSVNSNRCAAISGSGTANGVPVVQNSCSGASNQKWKLISVGGGKYQLQAANSAKCMDIAGMSTASGALVQQWACTAGNNQRFLLDPGSNCAPESSANFCARLGKNCGTVTGIDNCGMQRTVASCGTCQAPATCGDDTTPNVCSPTCSFTITQNVYDGPSWWGTISFRNNGPATSSNYSIDFHVPAGAHCTNDAVPEGATLSPLDSSGVNARTISNHCVFNWANATPLAPGAIMTMNYSTDVQNFSSASDVTASDAVCQ